MELLKQPENIPWPGPLKDICTRASACCCPCGPQGGSKHRTVPGGGANVRPDSPSCLSLLHCVATDTALDLSGPLLLDPLSKFGVRTKTEASQFCPVRIKGSGLYQARVGCGEWEGLMLSRPSSLLELQALMLHTSPCLRAAERGWTPEQGCKNTQFCSGCPGWRRFWRMEPHSHWSG